MTTWVCPDGAAGGGRAVEGRWQRTRIQRRGRPREGRRRVGIRIQPRSTAARENPVFRLRLRARSERKREPACGNRQATRVNQQQALATLRRSTQRSLVSSGCRFMGTECAQRAAVVNPRPTRGPAAQFVTPTKQRTLDRRPMTDFVDVKRRGHSLTPETPEQILHHMRTRTPLLTGEHRAHIHDGHVSVPPLCPRLSKDHVMS